MNSLFCPFAQQMGKVQLKTKTSYAELGNKYYEERYRDRLIKNLKKRAEELGFALVTNPSEVVMA